MISLRRNATSRASLIFAYSGLIHVGLLYFFCSFSPLSLADKSFLQRPLIVLLIGFWGGLTFAILERWFFPKMIAKPGVNFWHGFFVGGCLGIAATIGVVEVSFATVLAPGAYERLPDLLKHLTQLIPVLEVYLLEFVTLQLGYARSIALLIPLAFCYGGVAGIFRTWVARGSQVTT